MFPPILRDAVVFASILSMLSTGLTLTYMTTKVPNFAHGDFAVVSIYVSLILAEILGLNPYLGILPGFLVGGLAALILYLLILKPLLDRGASYVILMIATIAYDMILISAINILADYLTGVYKVVTRLFILKSYDFQVFDQPGIVFIAPLIAMAMVISLYLFLNKTKFGIAMRAAIENPSLAGVVGINVNLTYAVSWFISGGLAGISGTLMPLWLMCNPDLGMRLIVSIFAASIVGGLTNIYGAFIGGLLIGFAEVLGTGYLSIIVGSWIIPYRPIIPLVMMSLTLLFAPKGLTGIAWREIFKRGE
ncbi:MAG: branched-chain amino acid ABC transporter permease [Candidatus Hecatellales archaeon]|nr:MAG: branched-chain amino acid ABC transporter permease [Candidatus Hecatellales archaeon]